MREKDQGESAGDKILERQGYAAGGLWGKRQNYTEENGRMGEHGKGNVSISPGQDLILGVTKV